MSFIELNSVENELSSNPLTPWKGESDSFCVGDLIGI